LVRQPGPAFYKFRKPKKKSKKSKSGKVKHKKKIKLSDEGVGPGSYNIKRSFD